MGFMFGDSGSNANKSVQNIGFLMVGIAYLWYTTVMPSVLKCMYNCCLLYLKFINKCVPNLFHISV